MAMQIDKPLVDLPKNFYEESKALKTARIRTWSELNALEEKRIFELVRSSRATTRNLKRLKGMAKLICQINIAQNDAALLIHSGISTIKAIATCTPQELIQKTSRLERQMNISQKSSMDYLKARSLIKQAQNRQKEN